MNDLQQNSLLQLMGNSNLQNIAMADIEKLSKEYPYFAVPHFFSALKNKQQTQNFNTEEAKKAIVYFNNPHWFYYQLLQPTEAIFTPKNGTAVQQIEAQEEVKQPVSTLQNNTIEVLKNTTTNPITIPTIENVKEILQNVHTTNNNSITSIALDTVEEIEVAENDNSLPQPTNNDAVEIIEQKVEAEINHTSTIIQTSNIVHEETTSLITNETTNHVMEEEVEQPKSSITEDKLASILQNQLAEFKKPVTETSTLSIDTEPYHTVDYFASQGIKADYQANSQDKLSSQLRRFTDWLKLIKHNQPVPEDLGTDPELENAIQGIAQTSNQAKEIVTETMAEVLEKQGKTDKAIQLYIKLSFLNPEKSAYFAAKIQQLKGI